MPRHIVGWTWEEAFCKFGFEDGDGPNFTWEVARAIRKLGYKVVCGEWGIHNYMIMDIEKDNVSIIPKEVKIGYDNPRSWLPDRIIRHLDTEFPEEESNDPV